jgi:hypothetical protein
MLMLAVVPYLGLPPAVDLTLRLAVPGLVFLLVARDTMRWKLVSPWLSLWLGIAVFGLWVAPDLLVPGWREHWLFQNVLTGKLESSMPEAALRNPLLIALRVARAVVVVPLVEEVFWRGWLMRWLIRPDFESVPLGSYTRQSFWITAALFAAVHGPYWEVGLLTGAIYGGWMVRTRSLADLVWAHAVTNACLAAFVIMTNRWEYWL